ncbi:TrkH-domain-containing protein [Punctularia strigosozonata HHB-11173 SS5]|uniref:TrkH-domain-containing protein n=1 Tax=Punctularia strigosozonata (strain HHB-11173) TaxID=741275 RepID=UPI0004418216|nr:TrkH-domain-containing protein [Punctularia strigosozonata HHB-11173 SS5]EIN11405.1 TrkH-domain-containing protein [Punctularia strigosozonata HHB-11173 SS5]
MPRLSSFRLPHIQWNFFRIHLAFFTIHPLIWSAIFWGANGRYHISYVDSLFLCYSSQTVTGLSTINLSTTTGFQQAILYWLMVTGDYSLVSWVMVLVRRHYFKRKCVHLIRQKRQNGQGIWGKLRSKTMDVFPWTASMRGPDQTHRLDLDVVNGPSSQPALPSSTQPDIPTQGPPDSVVPSNTTTLVPSQRQTLVTNLTGEDMPEVSSPTSISHGEPFQRTDSPSIMSVIDSSQAPPAVTFAPRPTPLNVRRTNTNLTNRTRRTFNNGAPLSPGGMTDVSGEARGRRPTAERHFGGFPGPFAASRHLMLKYAPDTYRKLERKLTLIPEHIVQPPAQASSLGKDGTPREKNAVDTFRPRRSAESDDSSSMHLSDLQKAAQEVHVKVKDYIKSGSMWIGRNSFFDLDGLTDEQIEEVGGVEYTALTILSWLVPAFFVVTQLICFIVFYAYLKTVHTYDSVFDSQPRQVPIAWFSFFQVLSAYTGGGLSLVDAGMGVFLPAFPLVIILGFLIIVANILMPVFLRWTVYALYRLVPQSQERAALQFLLDHPRRCYLYLFPAHQSWFLVAVFLFLTAIEWAGFIVFDLGLPVTDSLPRGQRVLAGWFQSLGVRASGFSIVSLNALSPATKLLYLVMMYISAYPIAMSIRATNVYEERSLGVFKVDDTENTEEPKGEVFSKYLGWHLRRQLSFDLWWLAAAMLIICIIERANIMDPSNDFWFNQFTVLFEIVSAYGTIGLSLGIPTENYSFSGALRTGSKLVLILVMLRGRHRDLPVAVDRAILLPEEFSKTAPDPENKARHIVQGDLEDPETMSERS